MRYLIIVLILAALAFALGLFHRDGERPASWWALVLLPTVLVILYYDIRKLILLLRANRQDVENPGPKDK